MRYLPNGHLVYADDNSGTLVRVDPTGVKYTVQTGMSYPNGLAVDQAGMVYVTEHNAGRIRRVNPMGTNDSEIVMTGLDAANGISFNVDYTAFYFAEFCGTKTVWRATVAEDGTVGPKEAFATNVGSGCLDGIGVDICGNVYICDYMCDGNWDDTCVFRISPDGSIIEKVIDPSQDLYIPNLQWGSGLGGWSANRLYLAGGWGKHVYEVDVGLPGKPKVFP
jgi:sugar lactone lactonase YvrE